MEEQNHFSCLKKIKIAKWVRTSFVLIQILLLVTLESCTSTRNLGKDHLTAGSCEAEFTRTKLPEGQSI